MIAETIYTNGKIYTVDPSTPWVEALAVANGQIVARGTNADVEAYKGAATQIVDLGGKMAMPGIVDVHNHILLGGMAELYELRFPGSLSREGICALVKEAAEKAAPGEWIIGAQLGADMNNVLNSSESLAMLDAASNGHPVLLRDETFHNRWVNSKAMELAGITEDMPNPDQGEFGRDPATGKLTGFMIEAASGVVERALIEQGGVTPEMGVAAVKKALNVLNGFGVTAFLDAASMENIMQAIAGLYDEGGLTAWAACAMPAVEPTFLFGISGDDLFAKREQFRRPHVKPDFVKFFLDGVPGAKTAAFHDAYLEDPIHGCCFRGATMMTYPDLIRWLGKCEEQNLAVKIHCAGDAAVSQALDAIDVVRSFNGPTHLVHHIAHASYIRDEDIARFAELNVAADLSPMIWYPTTFLEAHKQAMGEERAEKFWPNKNMQEANALMAGGSDWPVIPNPNPWDGIEGLVTRENPSGAFEGKALWREQALDLASAVEIFTLNSAKALGLDKEIGSFEVGKSADLIVLNQNIFDVSPKNISDTKVDATYFQGKLVFERAVQHG
ncbi:hypothetical protein ATL17_3149 [Maritalea mobilis]|uniref:Amidohydrolase 3 domain-containing protein n=1 Tax=Maritalea mobilis TaxID=483324 RepID=A0A4R6VG24_9HYPH|nr:amidohydrolase [Maritalea mobilis]TDQ62045.1 hypothetical protein ATL17_3149 [Maritalea mobilis]